MAGRPSESRFARWSRLGGEPLTSLARLVEERLVPPLLRAGFERVETSAWGPDFPITGREILLERPAGDDVEAVSFLSDKHRRPAFQVHLYRRGAAPPYPWVRSANVVRRPRRRVCFWGRPWWLPARFWSARAAERTVDRLACRLDQALAFLDRGERGPAISRP